MCELIYFGDTRRIYHTTTNSSVLQIRHVQQQQKILAFALQHTDVNGTAVPVHVEATSAVRDKCLTPIVPARPGAPLASFS